MAGRESMRTRWLVLGMLAASTPVLAQQAGQQERPKVDFKKLEFMAGCWEGKLDKETVVEELWTRPAENLLLATTRYLKKNQATGFEFSMIQATDSAVTFSASSEGKPFDSYTLTKLVDEYVEFENLTKSFPQRIIYRLGSDGVLIPRNEGEGQPSVEIRMHKVKCPGT